MTRDLTNMPDDAAKAARADAWGEWQEERDEGGDAPDTGHDCASAPFPDSCLGCLAWERYWIKERAAVNEANNKEWWA